MAVARPSPFSTCRSMLPTCHSPINSCCSLYKTYPIGTHVLCFPVYTESSLRPTPSRRTLIGPGLIPALISSAPSLRGQIPNSDGRQANPLTTYLTPLESALTKNGRVTRSESADPKSLDLKSFRIRTSGKKEGGGGKLLTRNHALRIPHAALAAAMGTLDNSAHVAQRILTLGHHVSFPLSHRAHHGVRAGVPSEPPSPIPGEARLADGKVRHHHLDARRWKTGRRNLRRPLGCQGGNARISWR